MSGSTCWSVIKRAQGEGPEARTALDALIRRYDRTVQLMIASHRPPRGVSAEDIKQDFFLGFVRREDVRRLDRDVSTFRGWLYRATQHAVRNAWAHFYAKKRGEAVTSRDAAEVVDSETPERALMARFSEDTMLHALAQHRAEAHDPAQFDLLMRFLPGPDEDPDDFAALARELRIANNTLSSRLFTLRKRHQRILFNAVADTLDVDLSDPERAKEQIRLELRELSGFLRPVPPRGVVLPEP